MAPVGRRCARSPLLCFLAAVSLAVLFVGAAWPGGERPADRGGRGPRFVITDVERELGEMDPRLAEVLDAFGSSHYDECLKLAEALINQSDDSSIRAECVGLIILSQLDQGDFAAAREAAERLRSVSPDVCQDLLARVNRDERDYNAEVTRLQHIVAAAKDPAEAARAQLSAVRVHHMFGLLERAERSCWLAIEHSAASSEAARATSRLALLAIQRGEYARGVIQMQEIARSYPSSPAALAAHRAIPTIRLAQSKPDLAISALSSMIELYPGTPDAAEAEFAIGRIHQGQGNKDEAIAAYLAAARNHRGERVSRLARDALARMHYARAEQADAAGDVTGALDAYRSGVHVDPDPDRKARYALAVAGRCYQLQRWAEAKAAAKEVLRLDPPEHAARRRVARSLMADVCYRAGLHAEALTRYEDLLAESQDPVEREAITEMMAEIPSQMRSEDSTADTTIRQTEDGEGKEQ